MEASKPIEGPHLARLYKGWRIVPIAVPVNDHFAARFRLLREPDDGITAVVDPFFAPGEFADTDEAWAGAIACAMISIDSPSE